MPRLEKGRVRVPDVLAWLLCGSWAVVVATMPAWPDSVMQHYPGKVYGLLFYGAIAQLLLAPVWLLVRLGPLSRRLADTSLRQELALTALTPREFLSREFRPALLRALLPVLLPPAGAILYVAASVVSRLTSGYWRFYADHVFYYLLDAFILITGCLLSAAGAIWLLAARCRMASGIGLGWRYLAAVAGGSGGVLLLCVLAIYVGLESGRSVHAGATGVLFSWIALSVFVLAAAQVTSSPRAASEGLPGPAPRSRPSAVWVLVVFSVAAISAGGWALLLAEHKSSSGWPWEAFSLDRDSVAAVLALLMPMAALTSILLLRRPDRACLRPLWPWLLVGCLAAAGGVALMPYAPAFPFLETPVIKAATSQVWPALCLAFPAVGIAWLVVRQVPRNGRHALLLAGQQLAATGGGIGLGLGLFALREMVVGPSGRVGWASMTGPLTLVTVALAVVLVVWFARRNARHPEGRVPAAAALLFGWALAAVQQSLMWVPNITVRARGELLLGAWVMLAAAGLALLSWKWLERAYFRTF